MIKFRKVCLLFLLTILLCTGCAGKKQIIDESDNSHIETNLYESGRIIIKDNRTYATTHYNGFENSNEVMDIKIGPENIKFEPKDEF